MIMSMDAKGYVIVPALLLKKIQKSKRKLFFLEDGMCWILNTEPFVC